MKLKLTLLTAILSLCFYCADAKVLYGPWIGQIDSTSFTVLWVTDAPSLAWVEVLPDDGTHFYSQTPRKVYQVVSGRRVADTFHCVKVDSLKPGTTWRYRLCEKAIADDSNPYAISYGPEISYRTVSFVTTLDSKAETCSFSVINDIHEKDDLYASLIKGIKASETDFFVLNGDIINASQSLDSVMKHTFSPAKNLVRGVPLVYARGNHESRGKEFHKVPMLFPTPTGEFYYAFRQGPVAVLVLDAGEDKPDSDVEYSGTANFDAYRVKQVQWLKQTLESEEIASAKWKIVIMHIPILGGKGGLYSQVWIRENFLPILNEYGVDLMLSGHHHQYIYKKKGEFGNEFPVIANDNEERITVKADNSKIDIRIFNKEGVQVRNLTIN